MSVQRPARQHGIAEMMSFRVLEVVFIVTAVSCQKRQLSCELYSSGYLNNDLPFVLKFQAVFS